MLKKIVLALVVIIAIFLVVVAMQPGEYRVTRSATIAAPPATVFENVNNLHKWDAWSPWGKIDPNMKMAFAGPESGVGSSYHWAGNSEVGEGTMTTTVSKPSELITYHMDFLKPMKGESDSEFSFKAEGANTVVTWSMYGKKNFISKAFCMFMSMDKMVGGEFEKGLADLKKVSEGGAK